MAHGAEEEKKEEEGGREQQSEVIERTRRTKRRRGDAACSHLRKTSTRNPPITSPPASLLLQTPLPAAGTSPGVTPLTHVAEGAASRRGRRQRLGVQHAARLSENVRTKEAYHGGKGRGVFPSFPVPPADAIGACSRAYVDRNKGG